MEKAIRMNLVVDTNGDIDVCVSIGENDRISIFSIFHDGTIKRNKLTLEEEALIEMSDIIF